MSPLRFIVVFTLAALLNVLLFLAMQGMTRGDASLRRLVDESLMLDIVRVEKSLTETKRQQREPEPVKTTPDPIPTSVPNFAMPAPLRVSQSTIELPQQVSQVQLRQSYIGTPAIDGEPLFIEQGEISPTVRINPQYPAAALMKRVEGHVVVELAIAADGSVSGAKVIEAVPARMFNQAAIRAVRRWRYAPRYIDGVAVEWVTRVPIDFLLE